MLKLFMAALYLLISGGASLAQEATPAAKTTPADGHTIHVTAPHLIDGKVRGPFHHYCKVVAPDPFIECLLYKTEDPNAKLIGRQDAHARREGRPPGGMEKGVA